MNLAAVEKLGLLLCHVILSALFARRTYAVGGAIEVCETRTLSSLQRAVALVGQRVVIELV
jgi:hypothetical protein